MSYGVRCAAARGLAVTTLAWYLHAGGPAAAQVLWTGPDITFSKPSSGDPLLPANQDFLTDNVQLTRGPTQGLVNAATECGPSLCSYTHNFSPADTEWATDRVTGNSGQAITATNFQNLTFTDWEAAYSNSVGNFIENRDAVVHLFTDDIYLDLRVTSWTVGGGGFTYVRSTPPPPMTTGDYNKNGIVDAADYTVWRDTVGQSVAALGDGADGDLSGVIDQGDYDFWAAAFGHVVNTVDLPSGPAATSGLSRRAATVPESAAWTLFAAAILAMVPAARWRA